MIICNFSLHCPLLLAVVLVRYEPQSAHLMLVMLFGFGQQIPSGLRLGSLSKYKLNAMQFLLASHFAAQSAGSYLWRLEEVM